MINAPEWSYRVLTNLKMKASDAFKDGELSPEQDESLEDEEKEELLKQLKFPWHCEKGIIGNMQKLNNEFNEFRGLNPVKIFVTGPPASGKTFYSQKLAQYYNIPHVSVKQLSDEALRISLLEEEAIGENAFWLEIKTKCDECRAKMTEEIETKRGDPPDGEEWPEINQATLPIRVPGDIIHKLLRQELVKNACRNRGYILDGYPRTFEDAQHCFLNKPIKYDEETGDVIDDDEDDLEEGQKKNFDGYLVDQAIVPKSCIVLTGNDADLTKRVKHLPESAIKGTHYTAQDMQRRLKAYRTANNSQVAEYSVSDFFEQQGISLFKKSCTTETNKALDAFKIYIERNEKPFNFMTYDEVAENKRNMEFLMGQMLKENKMVERHKQEEVVEQVLKKQKEAATKQRMAQLRNEQKEVLENKSQPIRSYLIDNLVPILTDGLLDICKRQPTDPVDSLAEYLFKRSLDVPYPDPTTY